MKVTKFNRTNLVSDPFNYSCLNLTYSPWLFNVGLAGLLPGEVPVVGAVVHLARQQQGVPGRYGGNYTVLSTGRILDLTIVGQGRQ